MTSLTSRTGAQGVRYRLVDRERLHLAEGLCLRADDSTGLTDVRDAVGTILGPRVFGPRGPSNGRH
jgi:hypothetical protein